VQAPTGDSSNGDDGLAAQVIAVQREIQRNGPVHACFDVFSDFFEFFTVNPTGVYNASSPNAQIVGGHCVKIIGWGTTAGVPFWLIANSWGTGWAQQGVFRYARGIDLGGMDTSIWAACPAGAPSCELTPAVGAPPAGATRRTGGMWHPVEQPNTQAHVAAALRAVRRDARGWAATKGGAAAARLTDARPSRRLDARARLRVKRVRHRLAVAL
jgi:hypothetical protein